MQPTITHLDIVEHHPLLPKQIRPVCKFLRPETDRGYTRDHRVTAAALPPGQRSVLFFFGSMVMVAAATVSMMVVMVVVGARIVLLAFLFALGCLLALIIIAMWRQWSLFGRQLSRSLFLLSLVVVLAMTLTCLGGQSLCRLLAEVEIRSLFLVCREHQHITPAAQAPDTLQKPVV